MQDQIPEWKRGSLVFEGQSQTERKTNRNLLMEKVNSYFKKISEDDEEYEKMLEEFEKLKSSIRDAKENVQQKVSSTDSKVFQKGVDLYDNVKKKMGSQTMEKMKSWDPDFDLIEFESEAKFIFETVYSKFLEHDIEYLEEVCASEALGYFKATIRMQETLGGRPKFPKPMFIKTFNMSNAFVHPESGLPVFTFLVDFAEISCLVSIVDPETVIEGHDNNLEYTKFNFVLAPSDDIDIGKKLKIFLYHVTLKLIF